MKNNAGQIWRRSRRQITAFRKEIVNISIIFVANTKNIVYNGNESKHIFLYK